MGRGGGREEGEEEEEEEARGRREGEGNGWEDATQVFPECSHPRLPNAKRPCTSQTELGNLHVGDKKSWAGKSSFFFWFLSSLPPHQTLLPIFSQQHLQLLCCAAQGCTCSVLLALPRSFGPLYSRSLSLLTLAIPHTAHCFQRLPLGA